MARFRGCFQRVSHSGTRCRPRGLRTHRDRTRWHWPTQLFAQYTEEPREPGIGTIVDTGDTAYLEVVVSGTATNLEVPEDMLEHGAEITELNTAATGTVTSFAPWEGTSSYIIGLDQKRPYAVTILEDPVRVVVDIQLENQ